MTKYALLTLLLVAPLVFWGQGLGPRIEFEQTEIDICDIMQGERAEFDFNFRNPGDAPLLIEFVKTSTGAAVATWPREPILPGESGTIHTIFDTNGKVGQQSKTVTVGCNDSLNPVFPLHYKCEVIPRPPVPTFAASDLQQPPQPEYVPSSTCLSFEKPCKEGLRIAFGSREPLVFYYDVLGSGKPTELRQLHQSSEVLSVDWTQGPQVGGKRDSVLVWFDTETVGPFSNSVILETSSKSRPLIYLHFEGRIVREEPFSMEEGK